MHTTYLAALKSVLHPKDQTSCSTICAMHLAPSSLTILQIRRLGLGVLTFRNFYADLRGLGEKDIDACGLESSMPCLGFPPLSVNRLASPHLSHTLPQKIGDCSKMSRPVVASSRQLWTTTAPKPTLHMLAALRVYQPLAFFNLPTACSLSLTTLSSSMLALVPGL